MAKLDILAGATSIIQDVMIYDSSVTTGAGLTGLAFNTGSLVASYVRPGAARVAITLATQTVTGAYSSGGFVEIDATNMPGLYRLDVPNAALASGARSVVVMLKGAANMVPMVLEIALTANDNQNAATFGLTNLDAAISTRLATSGYTAPDNSDIVAIKAKTDTIPASPASVSDIPTANQNADALLKRDWNSITGEAARSVLNALRFLRNKRAIATTTLTVTKEDDSTTAWTAALTTDSAAEPISAIDPS